MAEEEGPRHVRLETEDEEVAELPGAIRGVLKKASWAPPDPKDAEFREACKRLTFVGSIGARWQAQADTPDDEVPAAVKDPRLPVRLPVSQGCPVEYSQDMNRRTSAGSTESKGSSATNDSWPNVSAQPSFRIKNTFIDDFADDSSEETPGKTVKSCPARNRCSGSQSGLAYISEQELSDPFRFQTAIHLDNLQAEEGNIPPLDEVRVVSPVRQAEEEDDFAILPLESRKPQWSLGSIGHEDGDCKPCMWFWRPQGCTNKAQCQHCHLCPEGAVQERRKNRRQATRAAGSSKR